MDMKETVVVQILNGISKYEENKILQFPTEAHRSVGRKDDSKVLHLELFPALAAVRKSEFRDKYTVLVHLKAPSSNAIQKHNKKFDCFQNTSAGEEELSAQNYTNSESIIRSSV